MKTTKEKSISRHMVLRMSAFVLALMIGFPSSVFAYTEDPETENEHANAITAAETVEADTTSEGTLELSETPEQTDEQSGDNGQQTVSDEQDDTDTPADNDEPEAPVEPAPVIPGNKRLRVTGTLMNFEKPVVESRLSPDARPYGLSMKAPGKRIYLSWNNVANHGARIDGYIVLRRLASEHEYRQITTVPKDTSFCYDDKAQANTKYYYRVVSYVTNEDGSLQVSDKSSCVLCIRGDSKLINAYSSKSGMKPVTVINKSKAVLKTGGTVKLKLKFPVNVVSTWVRWRSSHPEIAKVDQNGFVTAVSAGTAKITGRTAAGWDISCTVTVRGKTKVTGIAKKCSLTSGNKHTDTIYVTHPHGRTLYLDMYKNGKWVKKKAFKLPNGKKTAAVKIVWPKDWWSKEKSRWRIRIPKSNYATAYKSSVIRIKAKRKYQNPKNMVQISQKISKHGHSYYTSPVQINRWSSRKDCVETMIDRAYDYLGDPFVVCRSRQPGRGVDCSGIVMQACYAVGVDLWPSNPYRHRFPKYEYESRYIWKNPKLQKVSWKNRKRGDLIFYANAYDTIIHVAIYLGDNKVIHSWPGEVQVSSVYGWGDHIAGVRRVFHK